MKRYLPNAKQAAVSVNGQVGRLSVRQRKQRTMLLSSYKTDSLHWEDTDCNKVCVSYF